MHTAMCAATSERSKRMEKVGVNWSMDVAVRCGYKCKKRARSGCKGPRSKVMRPPRIGPAHFFISRAGVAWAFLRSPPFDRPSPYVSIRLTGQMARNGKAPREKAAAPKFSIIKKWKGASGQHESERNASFRYIQTQSAPISFALRTLFPSP